jgi:hypothetical protein
MLGACDRSCDVQNLGSGPPLMLRRLLGYARPRGEGSIPVPLPPPIVPGPIFSAGFRADKSPITKGVASKPQHCDSPANTLKLILSTVCLQTSRPRGFSTEFARVVLSAFCEPPTPQLCKYLGARKQLGFNTSVDCEAAFQSLFAEIVYIIGRCGVPASTLLRYAENPKIRCSFA